MAKKKSEEMKKNKSWFERHPIASVLIAVIVIGGIINGVSNHESTVTTTPASTSTSTEPSTSPTIEATAETKKSDTPVEYLSALAQGTTYANTLHMSKQGVYDQLVSEYGGKFTAEAGQYAIDNMKADWNANALASAKTYQDTMHMSPAAIHDQLTSEYGEKFTVAEADYAMAHLND